MNITTTGRMRLVLGIGALTVAGFAVTSAAMTDSATVLVTMDGSQNRFDIVVAGDFSEDAKTWQPSAGSWNQGNPDAYDLSLGPTRPIVMSPGSRIEGRVAVRNDSPRLAGRLSLDIVDPQPREKAVDPQTGNFVELFDQLSFTVRDGGTTLLDHVSAAQLSTYVWDAHLPAGAQRVLDVQIEMTDAADNRWQLASTDIQFHFEAVTP